MIVVTGGAGFIGSNIVAALNARGRSDVLVVDDLTDGHKFRNLAGLDIADYNDRYEFLELIEGDGAPRFEAILHQGACSTTTEWDGRYMMDVNYRYSKRLFAYCQAHSVPFIYASSASVYGAGPDFVERPELEKPLNVYGYSKALFDRYVRRHLRAARSQVVGLRYFNVYGPNEGHKQSMASVAWHFDRQIREDGEARLFVGCDGYVTGLYELFQMTTPVFGPARREFPDPLVRAVPDEIEPLLQQADFAVVDPKCADGASSKVRTAGFVLGASRLQINPRRRTKLELYVRPTTRKRD